MKALIVALFVGVVSKIIADEAKEWLAWLPSKLIHWASRLLPVDQHERYEEEWLAHANDLPGNLTKLGHACGCFVSSVWIAGDKDRKILRILFLPFAELLATVELIGFSGMSLYLQHSDRHRWTSIVIVKRPEPRRAMRLWDRAAASVILGLFNFVCRYRDTTLMNKVAMMAEGFESLLESIRERIGRTVAAELFSSMHLRALERQRKLFGALREH